jgi:hypothetical protein
MKDSATWSSSSSSGLMAFSSLMNFCSFCTRQTDNCARTMYTGLTMMRGQISSRTGRQVFSPSTSASSPPSVGNGTAY